MLGSFTGYWRMSVLVICGCTCGCTCAMLHACCANQRTSTTGSRQDGKEYMLRNFGVLMPARSFGVLPYAEASLIDAAALPLNNTGC
jgi:hypothetical protein